MGLHRAAHPPAFGVPQTGKKVIHANGAREKGTVGIAVYAMMDYLVWDLAFHH